TAAAVSAVGFLFAGIIGYKTESSMAVISLPIAVVLLIVTLVVIRNVTSKDEGNVSGDGKSEKDKSSD
ncbi:MAG: hypothetical protein K6G11_02625, partial [Lachnospiraceae bacterium]|nr:hypothetical protein [Lachnospiraceae bacterium]